MPIDLNNLLRIARRWWWLLLLAPMLGGIAAYWASERQPEMFSSTATLLVTGGVSNTLGSLQASQDLTATYSMWAVSRPVLENAAEALDYDGGAGSLEGRVFSNYIPDTLFITVTAVDTDPARAALVANTVAQQFAIDVQNQTLIQNDLVRGSLADQISTTTDQISELQASINELTARQNNLTGDEATLLQSLQQERADLQTGLERLETTLRGIDLDLASAQTRISVSSPAVPPEAPYAPAKMRATAIGVFVGLSVAIAATFLLEYLDNTVRNREELARTAKAPVLAAVTSVPKLRRGGNELFVLNDPNSAPSEAMRLLRANLDFASAPNHVSSLTVTSPGTDEGKSTITANLGVVMANAGLKTVIIDADLRRPRQHKIFGVNNNRGLSTLLSTQDPDWRRGAMALSIKNLVLIPSGPLPPNPADLLSLERFNHVLNDLTEWADVVLIDSPPILSASDALVVATKSKGVVLVCKHGQTRNDAVKRSTSALNHAGVRLTGTVLNHTNSDEIERYGQYEEDDSDVQTGSRYYFGSERQTVTLADAANSSNGKKPSVTHVPAETVDIIKN